jgi:hypothetical protein
MGGLAIASRPGLRLNIAMPELTRRRSADHRRECWHVYYGDIQAGTIASRARTPHDTNPWEWSCGFHPGEQHNGTAATFDAARAQFEQAWRVFLSKRTEGDFQEPREERLTSDRPLADPDKAARKLVEIANTVEAVQNGRIHIELINAPFLRGG